MIYQNKQNTTATFYQTYQPPTNEPFLQLNFKMLNANTDTMESLTIQCQSLMQKLIDRVAIDESRQEDVYMQLQDIYKDVQAHQNGKNNDKEIDHIVKNRKENVKTIFAEKRQQLDNYNRKTYQQIKNHSQRLDFVQKQIEYQRQERQDQWSILIDTFQKEIVEREKQFKSMRNRQQSAFEETSLLIYQLQEQIQNKIDTEVGKRKQEHQTVIRLVSQCIQNVKYIY